jgi:hypothetical protein
MSKQVEVKVVVEFREPKRADVRVEVKSPEPPAPEPEEGGYGHGV